MNTMKTLLAAGALTLSAGMISPALAEDSGKFTEQANYTWQEIKDFSAEQSAAAQRKGQELVNDMDAAIDDLEARSEELAEDAGAKADEGWNDTMTKLREMKRIAAKQADALGDASESAWEETKQGFRSASDAFAEAYEEAENELESTDSGN